MVDLLSDIEKLNVLVVGDVMVDRYFLGDVTRISPEAPVPIVEWKKQEDKLGGAANVALNVAALGASVFLCGVVGKDHDSEYFFKLLEENGIDGDLIGQSSLRPMTVKTRVIANKQHLLRLDKESSVPLKKQEENILLEKLEVFFQKGVNLDVIILQDYNKGVLTETIIDFILQTAKRKNIPVAVDPKFHNFWQYKGVSLFKPNLKEVQDILPFEVRATKGSLDKAARYIRKKLQSELLFISLSEKGIYAASEDATKIFPTQKRKVADVCGAGDGVVAIASLALALGLGMEGIAILANLAGGQIVEKVGVATVDKKVLIEEWLREQLSESSNLSES